MSIKSVQTGNFSDYVPLLIEGFSYSWSVFGKIKTMLYEVYDMERACFSNLAVKIGVYC